MIRLNRLCRRRDHDYLGSLRHHDPGNNVGEYASPTEQGDNQPHHPHDGYVQIEVLGKTSAHARDLPVRTALGWAHELLASGHKAHPAPAIGADIGIVLNLFSAIVAVHGFAPLTAHLFNALPA